VVKQHKIIFLRMAAQY